VKVWSIYTERFVLTFMGAALFRLSCKLFALKFPHPLDFVF
jgi:hypothetical protein